LKLEKYKSVEFFAGVYALDNLLCNVDGQPAGKNVSPKIQHSWKIKFG
jgi:hypothetical protein